MKLQVATIVLSLSLGLAACGAEPKEGSTKAPDGTDESLHGTGSGANSGAETAMLENASLSEAARKGERVFLRCRSCHTVDQNGANGVGPNLHGIIGQPAASKAGYNYSTALAASGIVWDAETLSAFIESPTQTVPGSSMAFAGLSSSQDRDDLIAYLTEVTR